MTGIERIHHERVGELRVRDRWVHVAPRQAAVGGCRHRAADVLTVCGLAVVRIDRDEESVATLRLDDAPALDLVGANAYVGFCGTCDVLNSKAPFRNGLATNVGTSKRPTRYSSQGWHIARAA
ncbi:MAG: hypothetical protein ACXVQ5_00175, partial [Actinomycetota bacterium]